MPKFDDSVFFSALEAGRLEECIKLLASLPRVRPKLNDALMTAAIEAGRPKEAWLAAQVTREIASRTGELLSPRFLLMSSKAALSIGETAEAEVLIAEGRKADPDRIEVWDRLSGALARERKRQADARSPKRPLGEAIERADWATAFALLRNYEVWPEADWREVARLRALLHDWTGVLEVESRLVETSGLQSTADLDEVQLRLGFDARVNLGLDRDVLGLAQQVRERGGISWQCAVREASAYRRMGDPAAALRILTRLWSEGRQAVIGSVVSDFLALGDQDACSAFLENAKQAWSEPNRAPLIEAESQLLAVSVGPGAALTRVLELLDQNQLGRSESVIARYAAAAGDTQMLERLLLTVEGWREDPELYPLFLKHGAGILASHFSCVLNWRKVSPLSSYLAGIDLPPNAAAALAGLLHARGDYGRAREVLSAAIHWFPSSIGLWRLLFTALGRLNDLRGCADARAAMQDRLPGETVLNLIVESEPNAWDLDSLPTLLDHALASQDIRLQGKFFRALRRIRIEPEPIMRALDSQAAQRSAAAAARLEFVLAQAIDRQMLQGAVDPPPKKWTGLSRAAFLLGRADVAQG